METKRISELPANSGVFTGDELMEISTMPSSGTQTSVSKKSPITQIGKWIFSHLSFGQLQTTNKTIVGAINELKANDSGAVGPGGAPHNSVYRGKWLGTAPTAAQYAAIENNSFDDIYIGDYWYDETEGIHWRVAGINYYHGIGQTDPGVQNFHVLIIPDEPLIEGTFINEQGQLRYTQINAAPGVDSLAAETWSDARGFKYAEETFTVDYEPAKGERYTFTFPLQHIPACKGYFEGWMNVSTLPDGTRSFLPSTPALVNWQCTGGEDPNNPGHGLLTAQCYYNNRQYSQTGTLTNSYMGIVSLPEYPDYNLDYFNSIPNFPVGTQVTIKYKYYEEGYGALDEAEKIILSKFGSEHVMSIPTWQWPFGQITAGENSFIYSGGRDILRKTTLPTIEQITGNSSMSSIGEYAVTETSRYQVAGGKDPSSNNRYISKFSRYSSYRLPLFLYNPGLIHPGYSYWTCSHYSEGRDGSTYNNDYVIRFIVIDELGNQVADTPYGPRLNTGIRPIFALGATADPYPSTV